MSIVFEIDRIFNRRPGFFKSRLMYRVWWLWFAVAWVRIPFPEFCATEKEWLPRAELQRLRPREVAQACSEQPSEPK